MRLLLVLAAAVVAFPASAGAVEIIQRGTGSLDGRIVMSPAAERVETVRPDGGEPIGPGSTVRRSVILQNRTSERVSFTLDVAQVVGSTAELVVEVRHGVREGAAAWVRLERSRLTLDPGEQGTVGVTIRIPRSIRPGSKPFAVTATQRSTEEAPQGAGIAPEFRQVGIFILELPGDAPVEGRFVKATITSVQKSREAGGAGERAPTNERLYVSPGWTDTHDLRLQTEFENRGERLLNPAGRVIVRDVFGRVVQRSRIDEFTVYPGGSSAGTVQLDGLPSLGIFRVRVEIESEAGGRQSVTLPRFVFLPKWFLAALLLIALYLTWSLVAWRMRRRREWRRFLEPGDADGGADPDADAAWEDPTIEPEGPYAPASPEDADWRG